METRTSIFPEAQTPEQFVEAHKKLLALAQAGMTLWQLCAHYQTSDVTIRKWLRRAPGAIPPRLKGKRPAAPEGARAAGEVDGPA